MVSAYHMDDNDIKPLMLGEICISCLINSTIIAVVRSSTIDFFFFKKGNSSRFSQSSQHF